ncbi:hypothetical protein [Sulfitobacter sp. R18_1]|uniref:hypothetical protein n=1 Tax=Sulfitobacter sp. R18_1 TaxID=2821104 RepID=UPI001AD96997|nr:hypothetical protein [Sulfitobacter sp. R18_1]MBO9428767.1 hypothetical protein [Sulfitobacter sp. R18_1]
MTDSSNSKTILDKIHANLPAAVQPEALGLNPKFATITMASVDTHFEFEMALSDKLQMRFFGHVKTNCHNGQWFAPKSEQMDVRMNADVAFDIPEEHNDDYRHGVRDIYDKAFLKDVGEFCTSDDKEAKWITSDPSFLFASQTIKHRDDETRPVRYMEWLSDKLETGDHDLDQVRVMFDEDVFDGHGKFVGGQVLFSFSGDGGLTERFDDETMLKMIDAGILLGRTSTSASDKTKAKFRKRIEEPGRVMNTLVGIEHGAEDIQVALKAIGLTDMQPFVPIRCVGKHKEYANAILDAVLARHNIEPQPAQSGPKP